MKDEIKIKTDDKPANFIEGVDYYFENGLMILTAYFLSKRGSCCDNGCRNCPYEKTKDKIYNK